MGHPLAPDELFSKADVLIPPSSCPNERFFSSLVFATVAHSAPVAWHFSQCGLAHVLSNQARAFFRVDFGPATVKAHRAERPTGGTGRDTGIAYIAGRVGVPATALAEVAALHVELFDKGGGLNYHDSLLNLPATEAVRRVRGWGRFGWGQG